MCGFPKDTFYYYKAWWGKEPMIHLFPHWNFEGREGEEIPVWVYSNLEEVELFVNGKSLGKQKVPHLGHVEWKVRYEPGAIEARGYKDGKVVLTEKRETTGPAVAIRLTADRTEINADGEDLAFLTVEALDKEGRPVPTADNLIGFKVTGEGVLHRRGQRRSQLPGERQGARSARSSTGSRRCIVQSTKQAGTIEVEVTSGRRGADLTPAKLTITTKAVQLRATI